jgi:hypothetical protein
MGIAGGIVPGEPPLSIYHQSFTFTADYCKKYLIGKCPLFLKPFRVHREKLEGGGLLINISL